jgi:RHS repeat-associated protein
MHSNNVRISMMKETRHAGKHARERIVDAVAARFTADDMHVYLHDANYNVTALADPNGNIVERYSYTPYGGVVVLDPDFSADSDGLSDVGNEYLYTGRRRDPVSGLQLNRNRFYEAALGRWLSRDPIGYRGQYNLFEYVSGRPNNFVDPSGLGKCEQYFIDCIDWAEIGLSICLEASKSVEERIECYNEYMEKKDECWDEWSNCEDDPEPEKQECPKPWHYWITPIETEPGQGFLGPFGPPVTMPWIPGGIIPIGPPVPGLVPVPAVP